MRARCCSWARAARSRRRIGVDRRCMCGCATAAGCCWTPGRARSASSCATMAQPVPQNRSVAAGKRASTLLILVSESCVKYWGVVAQPVPQNRSAPAERQALTGSYLHQVLGCCAVPQNRSVAAGKRASTLLILVTESCVKHWGVVSQPVPQNRSAPAEIQALTLSRLCKLLGCCAVPQNRPAAAEKRALMLLNLRQVVGCCNRASRRCLYWPCGMTGVD